jgi:hypothetical protein
MKLQEKLFWMTREKKIDIPVIGREGPQGWETSRLPHFLDNRFTDGGEVELISVEHRVDSRAIVWLEGLRQLKNPWPNREL